ncbi:hypothetical protein ILUMI_08658 [Ignelater luminosus]|uniref:Cyclic GMP-AMP synthase n=1 Tax=Ignelater luminosus TaxID=2038154 RepID=A0A8K0DAV2_IGNLU|nr:hypothetical protein ILUMI_08658 [Ignelater luminosus]
MKPERKKYNYMEPVLHKIHKNYISLPNKDVKRNNNVVKQVLQTLIKKMKKVDSLFKTCFTEVFYGGSFYDGLKIGKPDEFDLDFLLKLPANAQPCLDVSHLPGFVQVQLKNFENFQKTPEAKSWSGLANLLSDKHFLITTSLTRWMQGVLDKALNELPRCKDDENFRIFKAGKNVFKGTLHKAGPAQTLKLKMCGTIRDKSVEIDIDLVPCFKFGKDQWPSSPFRTNPVKNKPDFFIVPQKPYSKQTVNQYWRLSFQMQESELIKNKKTLKPTLRLLKKLQKNMDQNIISSYYIKTMFLWETEKNGGAIWNCSQSFAFVTMLKKYKEYIENDNIPFYWNGLTEDLKDKGDIPLQNLANRLQRIINAIESHLGDPYVVAEYLLNKEELASFKAMNGYQ